MPKHDEPLGSGNRPPSAFVIRPEPPTTRRSREALQDLARQLGLDRDDRVTTAIVGDELHITLTPLGLAKADATTAGEAEA